ncbi:hypothetical protein MNEG_8819 [Monoraphidium neglectum]|uniref:SPRY domain-containing protein n=1 Tax=Monoraphidium neglectum TaxID=145388 RepID=A0A0D2MYE9_9CHLO|nr:hypothetical protein MNEG_8819 [Monoraphidium neglectum]KIY99145.1 hypothetical protein MNEG_8819 [Monoraphidium neglectum]|eukprot:XP_013898165.1 hypothetical protein MNEG_8819 [Monoraphidium neglectum]
MATPLQAALDYVLPLASRTQPGAPPPADDEHLAAANFRLFDLNAEARDALARQQRAGPGRGVRGRVGPPKVAVDLASATPFLTVSGPSDGTSLAPLSLESAQGFSSCRANTAVVSGKWQYEVILRSHGILQLGWCLRDTPFTINNGVGDAPDSYAYDGKRMKRWNPAPVGTITFYRNGVSLGTAFANVRVLQHGAAYFPGLSLSQGERCDVNFGQSPFVHPVGGHRPLQAPPPPAAEGYFRAVTSALARLLLLRLRRCAGAACGGGRACAGCGAGGGAAGVTAGEAAAVEGRLLEFLRAARAADAAAAADARAAHAARGGADAHSSGGGSGGTDEPGPPDWPGDDAFALLAGLVGDHLLWLLEHSEWWLHAHLLPLVLRVHGLEPPHAGGAARALVQLCQVAVPAEGFGKLVCALGRVLGHYASMAPFQRPPGADQQHQGQQAQQAQQQDKAGAAATGSGGGAHGLQQLLPPPCGRQAPGVFAATGFSSISQLSHTGAYPFTSALAAIVALPDAASAWA